MSCSKESSDLIPLCFGIVYVLEDGKMVIIIVTEPVAKILKFGHCFGGGVIDSEGHGKDSWALKCS